ncbi:MAG: agmatine deiminase family protein [Pseudomonadota bacterium]
MSGPIFSPPPEWAPQAALWVGWPHLRGEWGSAFDGARSEIAAFIRAVCQATPVKIACGSREAYASAYFALQDEIAAGGVSLHTLPAGDVWLRDTGPIIATGGSAAIAHDFQFNGWGGKYEMPGDTMTASAITSVEELPRRRHAFVLEGGAVEFDGDGRVMTTRQCLLNPNRNPDWTQTDAETALEQAFNIDQVIWLDQGLLNDHTDGHIDNIARFIGPDRVVCQTASGQDDPNAETLAAIEATLRQAGLRVETVPSPGLILDETGAALPASHMNFVLSNKYIYLPVYEETQSRAALAQLEVLLPGYKGVALAARNILSGGGAFHCMTQQIPALEGLVK